MNVVLDVSVALAWCFEDEMTEAGLAFLDRIRTATLLVPAVWHVELANALWQGQRRNRIDEAATVAFDVLIRQLDVKTDHEIENHGLLPLIALARRHGLTAYDACYLELAQRRTATLATRDAALRRAAEAAGVSLASA